MIRPSRKKIPSSGTAALKSHFSLIVLLFILWIFAGCRDSGVTPVPPASHIPGMRGCSYPSFQSNGFSQGCKTGALSDLQNQTAAQWVAVCITQYQRTAADTIIAPNTDGKNPLTGLPSASTSDLIDIGSAVQDAHKLGMKIMLKPHVDLYDGTWRAAIVPDGGGKWFHSYQSMIIGYAHAAESLHVEMLCIGTELMSATRPQYESQWRTLIAAIRGEFHGRLTYAANWAASPSLGIIQPEFTYIPFWNLLDEIGIDAYFPLTESPSDPIPTYHQAMITMSKFTLPLQLIAERTGENIIITEIGLQSVTGALASPWDFTLGTSVDARQDTAAQDFYYRVMIDALGKQSWCDGMFWWYWESVPSQTSETDFTPENKPAASTLRKWYSIQSSENYAN